MKIRIQRAFSAKKQIKQYEPVESFCSAEMDIEIDENNETREKPFAYYSAELDKMVRAEVEKTLNDYIPLCQRCGGRGKEQKLNEEGLCPECEKQNQYNIKDYQRPRGKKEV